MFPLRVTSDRTAERESFDLEHPVCRGFLEISSSTTLDYLTRPRPPPDTHANTSTFTTHCTQLQQQQRNLSRPFAYTHTHASPFTRRVSSAFPFASRHADWWYSASRERFLFLSLSLFLWSCPRCRRTFFSSREDTNIHTDDRNLCTATIHRTMARVFPRAPKIASTGGGQASVPFGFHSRERLLHVVVHPAYVYFAIDPALVARRTPHFSRPTLCWVLLVASRAHCTRTTGGYQQHGTHIRDVSCQKTRQWIGLTLCDGRRDARGFDDDTFWSWICTCM